MPTDQIIELVKKLNEELYPDMDSDHRFGEVGYHSNYWCDSITIGDHTLWDCNHPSTLDDDDIEKLVRRELMEYCKFFAESISRIKKN